MLDLNHEADTIPTEREQQDTTMSTIHIQIKAFATTRQILGSDKLSLEIPAGSTITDMLDILVSQ